MQKRFRVLIFCGFCVGFMELFSSSLAGACYFSTYINNLYFWWNRLQTDCIGLPALDFAFTNSWNCNSILEYVRLSFLTSGEVCKLFCPFLWKHFVFYRFCCFLGNCLVFYVKFFCGLWAFSYFFEAFGTGRYVRTQSILIQPLNFKQGLI